MLHPSTDSGRRLPRKMVVYTLLLTIGQKHIVLKGILMICLTLITGGVNGYVVPVARKHIKDGGTKIDEQKEGGIPAVIIRPPKKRPDLIFPPGYYEKDVE